MIRQLHETFFNFFSLSFIVFVCGIAASILFSENETFKLFNKKVCRYSKDSVIYTNSTRYFIDSWCDVSKSDPNDFYIPRIADIIDMAVETALDNKKATALFKTTNGLEKQRRTFKDLYVNFRYGTEEFHQKNGLVETTEKMILKSLDCEKYFYSSYGTFRAFGLSIKSSSEQVKFLLENALNDWSVKKAHDAIVNEYEILINDLILKLNHLILQTGETSLCLEELEAFNDQLHGFIKQVEKNINGDIKLIESAWFKDAKSLEKFKSILENTDKLNNVRKEQIKTITDAKKTLQDFKSFLELRSEMLKKEEITKAYLTAQIDTINRSFNKLNANPIE